ncbi:hypothetical protein GCM10022419_099550 [Nonomuraea rosea]|uniref:Resolvase/invertase-type recombinase catalytic domain-containing protein n=2 Tax=Nonomuraea rosea TaxID=638574 RepID=A0ABP6Z8M6_9ACTN
MEAASRKRSHQSREAIFFASPPSQVGPIREHPDRAWSQWNPATSSRQLSLGRAGFTTLLHEAAVGDTIRIADAARLFRSVADIIALRPVLIRRGLHLRVESGLLSGIDLASDDPGTK